MYTFLLIIHILACIFLIVVILIQRGRGGGLVESFSGVESMFGSKTNVFLTRATTVFAVVFLFTSITLAVISARQSRSLIPQSPSVQPTGETTKQAVQQATSQQNESQSMPLQGESRIPQSSQEEKSPSVQ